MTHLEIREKFLNFFKDKGHEAVSSSSLLPDDPSVLFTTAGMQQFKRYFTGEADPIKDFGSRRTVSIQKAMRTSDIDEVGDESHLTFFEMLGHFSFGDYFKKETVEWTFEFLTKELGISADRISATIFAGDDSIPFDEESYHAWVQLIPPESIKRGPREDNVWGPAGAEGPCGAANEVYVDGLEVATLVFMEYFCAKDDNLTPLPQKGVDVGWGLERLAMVAQKKNNLFETDLFDNLMKILPEEIPIGIRRILVDHSRAIVFLIGDKVTPSNKEQGYILRRLIRRLITYSYLFNRDKRRQGIFFYEGDLVKKVIEAYKELYSLEIDSIMPIFNLESAKFTKTINAAMPEFDKLVKEAEEKIRKSLAVRFPYKNPINRSEYTINALDPKDFFNLYQSHGMPLEIINVLLAEHALFVDEKEFNVKFKEYQREHKEKSRAGAEKKFGGHGLLLDTGELKAADTEELKTVTRLHTATHLLHASLRKILGEDVQQAGSDITAERLRFDFTFSRKMTDEEIRLVEDMVNDVIQNDVPITKETLPLEEAKKTGALHFFKTKYPDMVDVYSVGEGDMAFSREFCGGPHVTHTGEIGKFEIKKEESVSAGVRRIRALVS